MPRYLEIYSLGLVHCSVCTNIEDRDELVAEVNAAAPSGTEHGWQISDEDFASGAPNPCQCEQDPTRKHYLFVC